MPYSNTTQSFDYFHLSNIVRLHSLQYKLAHASHMATVMARMGCQEISRYIWRSCFQSTTRIAIRVKAKLFYGNEKCLLKFGIGRIHEHQGCGFVSRRYACLYKYDTIVPTSKHIFLSAV